MDLYHVIENRLYPLHIFCKLAEHTTLYHHCGQECLVWFLEAITVAGYDLVKLAFEEMVIDDNLLRPRYIKYHLAQLNAVSW